MEDPNIIIRIPEPCHEDWNKMLPDEKGRFCNSCNKSVFDFSNKTDTQIKDILMAHNEQKVCGHFKKSQIDRPLNIRIDLNNLPKNISITKMFVIALFISFGTLLFSCTDDHGKKVGEINVEQNRPTEDPEKMTTTLGQMVADPMYTVEPVEMQAVEPTVDGGLKLEYYESHISGGISIQEEYLDKTITPRDSFPIDSIVDVVDETEHYMVGAMVMTIPAIVNEEYKIDTLISNDVIEKIPGTSDVNAINDINSDFIVFPNPTKGEFTLKYDVKKRSDVLATMIDINGITVRTIVNTAGQHTGKYAVPVNANNLINGVYFVNLTVDGTRRTQKIILEK